MIRGVLEIAKDALDYNPILIVWLVHEVTHLIHGESNAWNTFINGHASVLKNNRDIAIMG